MYCAVFGCLNSSTSHPEYSFFKLPTEPERRSKWLHLISREDLADKLPQNYTVCEEHFDTMNILAGTYRKKLKKNSLPSLHLPDLQNKDNTLPTRSTKKRVTQKLFEVPTFVEKCIQTEESITLLLSNTPETLESLPSDTLRKRKLKSDLLECQKIMKLNETENKSSIKKGNPRDIFHKMCDRYLTKELAELVKAQTYLKSKFIYTGKRYYENYKMFCLNLYYNSPQVYRLLRNALCLPCHRALNKHGIPLTSEINNRLMPILKTKVEAMPDMEKNCSVVIVAVGLKANLFYNIKQDRIVGFHEINGVQSPEPAENALVVMVRGLFMNWKQPVGFALLSETKTHDEIAKWIDNILEKLFEIGLNIRTFISNIETGLFNATKMITVTLERPYFFVNKRKIYYIFDTSDLIKQVHNNFVTYDFHFQNYVAKYEHIIQFYEAEKQKSFKLAPKLTDSHIYPTNFERMKVCQATQLLSNPVAAAISTYVDFNVIEESGRGTVELLKIMNNLFGVLNSSSLKDDYEYRRAFCGKESQVNVFHEMLNFFQQLKLIDPKTGTNVTSKVKFIEGFQITITSILLLFEDLKLEGCTYLFTKRLNEDILEFFLREIQTKSGLATKPTSRQFISAFQKSFFSNVLKLPKAANSAAELGKLLTSSLGSLNKASMNEENEIPSTNNEERDSTVKVMSSEYNQVDIPDKHSLFYICSHLLKTCAERHKDCQILKLYIKSNDAIQNKEESHYLIYKDYRKHTNKSLQVVPSDDFVQCVQKMDEIFRHCFQGEPINSEIAALIYKQMSKISFFAPCPCFPIVYLKKLFIRMRIFCTLKFNNKVFRMSRGRRKYFSVNHL